MADPKRPTDHLPKKSAKAEPDEYFTFDFLGKTYTMPNKTLDVLTPGFYRRHRNESPESIVFTSFEALAGDDEAILNLLDAPGREGVKASQKVLEEMGNHIGASLGE